MREGWNTEVPCGTAGFDFATVGPTSKRGLEAVEICLECPVMAMCLEYLKTTEVAGIAGSMSEAERKQWRLGQGVSEPRQPAIWEITPCDELTSEMLIDMPMWTERSYAGFSGDLIALVLRLTNDGWTARRIAALIPEARVRRNSIDYIRRVHGAESKMTKMRKERRKAILARKAERPAALEATSMSPTIEFQAASRPMGKRSSGVEQASRQAA